MDLTSDQNLKILLVLWTFKKNLDLVHLSYGINVELIRKSQLYSYLKSNNLLFMNMKDLLYSMQKNFILFIFTSGSFYQELHSYLASELIIPNLSVSYINVYNQLDLKSLSSMAPVFLCMSNNIPSKVCL